MSTNGKADSESANNDDILKSLRQLNSCITLTSVNNKSGPKSPSSSEESSDEEGTPDFPQLRGISIQGASKGADSLLNNLLGSKKDKPEQGKEESSSSSSQSTWINEWSKRCLSISFGPKKSEGSESEDENSEEEEQNSREQKSEKNSGSNVTATALKNGIQASSASNSEDSSENKKFVGTSSVSLSSLLPLSSSISFASVTAAKVQAKPTAKVDQVSKEDTKPISTVSNSVSETVSKTLTVPYSVAQIVTKSVTLNTKPQENPSTLSKSVIRSSISISGLNKTVTGRQSPVDPKVTTGRQSPLVNSKQLEKLSSGIPKKPDSPNFDSGEDNSLLDSLKNLQRVSTNHSKDSDRNSPLHRLNGPTEQCLFCFVKFNTRSELLQHSSVCSKILSDSFTSPSKENAVARKKTKPATNLHCFQCKVSFSNIASFESHHKFHVANRVVRVGLKRCSPLRLLNFKSGEDSSEDSDSRSSSASSNSSTGRHFAQTSGGNNSLKLTLKITNPPSKGKRGRKRKVVEIVNSTEKMIEKQFHSSRESSPFHAPGHGTDDPKETENQAMHGSRPSSAGSSGSGTSLNMGMPDNRESPQPSVGQLASQMPDMSSQLPRNPGNTNAPSNTELPNFNTNSNMNFIENSNPSSERPSSVYQPQFESFTGDWFNDYDSGSRIAAAMTGAEPQQQNTGDNSYNANMESSQQNAGGSTYDANIGSSQPPFNNGASHDTNSQFPNTGNVSTSNKDQMNSSDTGGGLFSQAVLGSEPTPQMPPMNEQRQGSFEQLCLNDSFGQAQETAAMPHSNISNSGFPSFDQNQQNSSNDLLSELAYLNNGPSANPNRRPSLEGDRTFNSHSNSGTPNSTGQPTPPPTDTSFRALATSPQASPTSPMTSTGPAAPLQNSTSPLQQMSQMGHPTSQVPAVSQQQTSNENVTGPRLTIANNLMATTTESAMPNVAPGYGQQWLNTGNTQQNYAANFMQNSMPNTMPSPLTNPMRPQIHAPLPPGYKPSPPPRIRGRPPLIGHIGRPPMMRGPGRPPALNAMAPLVPSGRGGMLPPMQRHSQYGAGRGGQKRPMQSANQSPSKSVRREDINVPARQKDNECQIIAVQNRADGIGVISNIQGGSSSPRDERPGNRAPATTDSTIHLSDSITLSVRSNAAGAKEAPRGEKPGEAGVVANLLASRGITVSPAAGEKEANAASDQRRLPTASDLNLSSAISVHPPTSRDRDGFAVPHPPASSSRSAPAATNQVDRPPRPPTVDLTDEVSSSPSHATRLPCSQCDRTFPTQSLLADHAKVHQQQAQTRMAYKCHLCTAGFSSQKGQQHHYQQFHQLHYSAGDLAIPVVDFRNPVNVQKMARLGIRSFLPLNNLQNRGGGGIVGIPILSLENLHNAQMNLQQWGVSDVLTLGPPKALNAPR